MFAIHGFAMARDRGLKWQCPDLIERLAPRGRAGGLEEWCRQRHEIADDGNAARAVVNPDIRVSYRAVGDPDIERPAGNARLAASLDGDIGTQEFAFVHGRDEYPDFVLLGLAHLRVVEHLSRGLEITGEEPAFREDAIDRIRRVHRCRRESGLDPAIAACMVQVPVRVHDRGDRQAFRPGKREDGVAVPVVPAGIYDDESLRRSKTTVFPSGPRSGSMAPRNNSTPGAIFSGEETATSGDAAAASQTIDATSTATPVAMWQILGGQPRLTKLACDRTCEPEPDGARPAQNSLVVESPMRGLSTCRNFAQALDSEKRMGLLITLPRLLGRGKWRWFEK